MVLRRRERIVHALGVVTHITSLHQLIIADVQVTVAVQAVSEHMDTGEGAQVCKWQMCK